MSTVHLVGNDLCCGRPSLPHCEIPHGLERLTPFEWETIVIEINLKLYKVHRVNKWRTFRAVVLFLISGIFFVAMAYVIFGDKIGNYALYAFPAWMGIPVQARQNSAYVEALASLRNFPFLRNTGFRATYKIGWGRVTTIVFEDLGVPEPSSERNFAPLATAVDDDDGTKILPFATAV